MADRETMTRLVRAWRDCEPEHRAMVLRTLHREAGEANRLAADVRTSLRAEHDPDTMALANRLTRGRDAYRMALEILEACRGS